MIVIADVRNVHVYEQINIKVRQMQIYQYMNIFSILY